MHDRLEIIDHRSLEGRVEMPLEMYAGNRVQMKGFSTWQEFNIWATSQGRHIRIIHLSSQASKESWRVLATYVQDEKR